MPNRTQNSFELAIEKAKQNMELANSEKQKSDESVKPVQTEEPGDNSSTKLTANTTTLDIPNEEDKV